jgi:hypothetical protein
MTMTTISPIRVEDAEKLIIRWIRERPKCDYPNYGYDLCVSDVIRWHLQQSGMHRDHSDRERHVTSLSPQFYAAARELCRRGIVRPGFKRKDEQVTDMGSGGDGYSITPFGGTWAKESTADDYVPTEPQRFGKMLEPYRGRFGCHHRSA